MLTEEHGLALGGPNPFRAAMTTFLAFLLVGFLPLLAFVCQFLFPEAVDNPYLWSTIITSAAFFGVGAGKSWFVQKSWYWEGTETLLVGGAAAGLAYLAGMLFGQMIGV